MKKALYLPLLLLFFLSSCRTLISREDLIIEPSFYLEDGTSVFFDRVVMQQESKAAMKIDQAIFKEAVIESFRKAGFKIQNTNSSESYRININIIYQRGPDAMGGFTAVCELKVEYSIYKNNQKIGVSNIVSTGKAGTGEALLWSDRTKYVVTQAVKSNISDFLGYFEFLISN